MPSRLTSRAAAYRGQAARASIAQGRAAAATGASFGVQAAREAARVSSYPVPTNVLSSTDTGGGTAKISTADHTRVYPVQGSVDVPDLAIAGVVDVTGLANATTYYAYYDDTTLTQNPPLIQVTTDPKVAQVGYAAGRHYLGKIATPAAGAGGTAGSGGEPPGGGGGPLP